MENISLFSSSTAPSLFHNKLVREEKNFNSENMSNPVVFFDMEIGGQPAGRIEMTVRICVSFLFSLLCKVFPSSSRESVDVHHVFSLR